MSKWAQPAHKKAANCLGYALTLGSYEAWANVAFVWAARLSKNERAALAYAALLSLDDDTAYRTASAVLFGTRHGEDKA